MQVEFTPSERDNLHSLLNYRINILRFSMRNCIDPTAMKAELQDLLSIRTKLGDSFLTEGGR